MTAKHTYEELEQRVKELEKEVVMRKQVEKALRESEHELNTHLQNTPIVAISWDLNFRVVKWNHAAETVFGYSKAEAMGKHATELLLSEELKEAVNGIFQDLISGKGGTRSTNENITKDNRRLICDWYNTAMKDADGKVVGVASLVHDITYRKRTEKALQVSEKEYRSTLNNLLIGVVVHAKDTSILLSNPEATNILGLTYEQMSGKKTIDPAWNFVHADSTIMKVEDYPVSKVFSTEKPFNDYVIGIVRPDKDYVTWVMVNAIPVFSDDGELDKVIVNFVDITEHKKAEASLQESESKYRMLVENLPQKIFYKNGKSVYVACNENFAKDLNIAPDGIVGKTDYDFFPKELAEKYRADDARIIQSGGVEELEEKYLFEGQDRVVQTVKTAVTDDNGDVVGLLGIFWDITEKRRLESQLKQSQKMESVGTMAGGIAHDFNNILGIIIGNAELAIDDIPEGNPVRMNLDGIKTASLRARDVVRQLLNFSRKEEQNRKPIKIHQIIKESIKLIRASTPATIDIRSNISDESGTIIADPTQIHQVLINLCTNANHAMEEKGGVLEISLDEVEMKEAIQFQYKQLEPGMYVQLIIRDTGVGIDAEIQDKIFDPYFTTKDVGKGTGMGLSVVHGIVNNFNGAISINSRPNTGTEVIVLFPIIDNEIITDDVKSEVEPTGTERIMLVDDEEFLLKMGGQILERLGYKVETFIDPLEALKLFRENPAGYDLIITDMTMPKITGDIFTKEIFKIRAETLVIICSGFNDKMSVDIAKKLGAKSFLDKPIVKADLAKTVRKVLDEEKSSTQG